jgi:hypothetical protein
VPSADLVAEQPEPSELSGVDRALSDDAAISPPIVANRRGLDDELTIACFDLERRMIKSKPGAM